MSENKDDSKTDTKETPKPSGGTRWDQDPKGNLREVTNVERPKDKPDQLSEFIKNQK